MSYVLVRPKVAFHNTLKQLKSKFMHRASFVSGNKSVILKANHTKVLKYDRLLPTGFGDRVSVYLSVAAAAATVGADVYVYWHDNPSDKQGCSVCSLAYESISHFVQWPANLHVLRKADFKEKTRHMDAIEFDRKGLLVSYYAFDGIYTTAWKTLGLPIMLPQLRRNAFELSYRKIALEMRIKCYSHECHYVNTSKFIVLHFRGGDKMAPLSEFNTIEVLRRIPGHIPVVVVTDDDRRLNAMLSLAAPYKANITRLRKLPNELANKMRDFAVLLNATGIIQHAVHAWSSYSSVPAMMRGIPLLNTWVGREEANLKNASKVGLLRNFEENGGCPVELRSSKRTEEVSVFINTVTSQM